MTPIIQADLAAHDLLPSEQIVDAGCVTAEHLVSSQKDHAVTLFGLVAASSNWQAKSPEGFDVPVFAIDWEA